MTARSHRFTVAMHRPRFFSRYEWRYHWLMMPILFPVGNYYFIGSRYFQDPLAFSIGTGLVFCLYWLSVVVLTVTIRWVIRRYPTARQTLLRTGVMLGLVGGLTGILAIFDVWVYSLTPATGVRFNGATVRPILVLGLVFDVFLCMALGLIYTYTQWKRDQREDEQLQRESIQRQYDTLIGQLNPHFLFNSLNSLSLLISQEPKQAEEFVDKLALVYRYMLQPGRGAAASATNGPGELVTLLAELEFMDAYADLLQIRYGRSLQIRRPVLTGNPYATYCVPPLSLLTLIDNAIKHNGMSAGKPLIINIKITDDGWIEVTNNRHRKAIRLETGNRSLGNLAAKYRGLSEKPVTVDATGTYFRVAIPLLYTTADASVGVDDADDKTADET